MAGKSMILALRIVGDSSRAVKALEVATGGLDAWENRVRNAALGASAVSAGVLAFGKDAIAAASDLQQSVGAVDSVFGDSAQSIHDWASHAATAVGLSKNEYNEFASVIGAQLKNLQIPQEEVAGTTNELIELGADLASMFGGTTADAVTALSAVFRGETDPIERYGVSIKQSDVNARLAAEGLDQLEGDALKQAEAQARLALVFEQTADAQGNFARETDTAAHAQQVAKAKWEDAKAALGEGLLPVVTDFANQLGGLAQVLGEHPQEVTAVAFAVLGLTGALWGAWAVIKTIETAQAIAHGIGIAWTIMTGQVAGSSVAAASTSAASAGAAKTPWIIGAAQAAGAWVVNTAKMIGGWVLAGSTAVVQAGIAAGAWVAQAARSALGLTLYLAKLVIVEGATMAWTGAQWLLNAALSANPIGIIIVAIGAVVAGLVLAYNKSETFRNFVQSAAQGAADAFWAVVDAVKSFIDWVKGGIEWLDSLIDRIFSLSWPSPPQWVSDLFGFGAAPELTGALDPGAIMRFYPQPPAVTAAAAYQPRSTGLPTMAGTSTNPVNVFNITVEGALDPVAVADQIKDILRRGELRDV